MNTRSFEFNLGICVKLFSFIAIVNVLSCRIMRPEEPDVDFVAGPIELVIVYKSYYPYPDAERNKKHVWISNDSAVERLYIGYGYNLDTLRDRLMIQVSIILSDTAVHIAGEKLKSKDIEGTPIDCSFPRFSKNNFTAGGALLICNNIGIDVYYPDSIRSFQKDSALNLNYLTYCLDHWAYLNNDSMINRLYKSKKEICSDEGSKIRWHPVLGSIDNIDTILVLKGDLQYLERVEGRLGLIVN